MRSLEARLQRLEQAANRPFREDPEFKADLACLGSFEVLSSNICGCF